MTTSNLLIRGPPASPDCCGAARGAAGPANARERGRLTHDALGRDDPRLEGTVHLAYRDGANLMLPHAFIENDGDWVYVFTRDHGYFVAHNDSVATCTSAQPAAPWAAADRGEGSGTPDGPPRGPGPAQEGRLVPADRDRRLRAIGP